MNVWTISIQNLKSKPLYTFLSVFVLSLSIALLLAVNQIKQSFTYQIENNLGSIDLVIGAKGSPLQLVLASVLHIDNPTGNISFAEAEKVAKNPLIKYAVPISYGDNYKGYKIVGTTPQFLELYKARLEEGNLFETSFEVIIGQSVANSLQLKIGDRFKSSHGLIENSIDVHDDEFRVVGIIEPTQKVVDRLILSNLESIWNVHEHGEEHNTHEHDNTHEKDASHLIDEPHVSTHSNHDHDKAHVGIDEHSMDREITSLLVNFRNPIGALTMPRKINKDTNMMAALPKYEMSRLYEFTGLGIKTITWIAFVILFIAGMTIFISLYKMIRERAFDLAILRTYGASNLQLIRMIFYEGLILVILALLIGFMASKVGLYLMTQVMDSGPQYNLIQNLPLVEYLKIIGLVISIVVLSILLAIYPILKMNISKILRNEK